MWTCNWTASRWVPAANNNQAALLDKLLPDQPRFSRETFFSPAPFPGWAKAKSYRKALLQLSNFAVSLADVEHRGRRAVLSYRRCSLSTNERRASRDIQLHPDPASSGSMTIGGGELGGFGDFTHRQEGARGRCRLDARGGAALHRNFTWVECSQGPAMREARNLSEDDDIGGHLPHVHEPHIGVPSRTGPQDFGPRRFREAKRIPRAGYGIPPLAEVLSNISMRRGILAASQRTGASSQEAAAYRGENAQYEANRPTVVRSFCSEGLKHVEALCRPTNSMRKIEDAHSAWILGMQDPIGP
ncbi:hypothetical protein CSOJ01_04962 [Colletotrichum sojae]|uniref:Uncharacterized protein n=1 Tax=Colletotrichum sojae TaxID=2175907 RepID=A0A8H6MYF1_9PEZI|nr:hypothetical protein CSOJ01_04962 [Colletotrichum sojae]